MRKAELGQMVASGSSDWSTVLRTNRAERAGERGSRYSTRIATRLRTSGTRHSEVRGSGSRIYPVLDRLNDENDGRVTARTRDWMFAVPG